MNRKLNIALWVAQGLLALFFVFASGVPKFFVPDEVLNMPIPIPDSFLYFIALCEISGGLGLVLPGLLRIRPALTPIAAFMLVLLTLCAATYQQIAGQTESAIFALGMGLICALVAYGRWRVPMARASSSRVVTFAGA